MTDPTKQNSFPRSPRASGLANSSKRASLKTLAGAVLVLGGSLRNAIAEDDTPRAGDWLVRDDDSAAKPLASADIKLGEQQTIAYSYDPAGKHVRSDSKLNRILLIKLDPASFDAETAARAADGVVAYSALCTHQACEIGGLLKSDMTLMCGCHGSRFQPAQGGSVVEGPATRTLPSLPLKIDGGKLVLAGGFSSPPGRR